jgi:hypothetical protein
MTAKIKLGRNNQKASGNKRRDILSVWILPVTISGVLLVLAIFLLTLVIKRAFTPYANCNFLIVTQLGMDPFFCNGYDVKVFDATVFTIPGMKDVVDPPLELVRSAITWGVILLFAFISLFLTILIENWKTVVGLITFQKEEWKKFLASTRIWLFLFVGLCAVFYFAVIQ